MERWKNPTWLANFAKETSTKSIQSFLVIATEFSKETSLGVSIFFCSLYLNNSWWCLEDSLPFQTCPIHQGPWNPWSSLKLPQVLTTFPPLKSRHCLQPPLVINHRLPCDSFYISTYSSSFLAVTCLQVAQVESRSEVPEPIITIIGNHSSNIEILGPPFPEVK